MKHLLILLLTALSCTCAWAVPANNTIIKHIKADGTVRELRLIGDEHMHYFLDERTGEKLLKSADGQLELLSEDRLQKMQSEARQRRADTEKRRATTMAKAKSAIGEPGTIIGQKKGIVILVNFQDLEMVNANSQEIFDAMFNQEGYNQNNQIGSVSDYFKAQSYGQFELDFDVVGPLTVSRNMAYYGQNNYGGSDMHAAEMVKEACQLADEQVNFADYDWDGDGRVDQVFVVYAGHAESSGADANTIWPHEWDLYSAGVGMLKLDNVNISTYACSSELSGASGVSRNGIGTACHEFSHCLGYPDFYDTDYSGALGVDSYDIMSGGSYNGPYGKGEVPCGYSAYERWMAGWLEPIELNDVTEITGMPALNDQGVAYIIYNGNTTNEYFLIENRQSREWFRYFSTSMAGHGLFIYHVDFNLSVWQMNRPNDDPNHQRMTWVPADKKYGTYYSQYNQWYVTSSDMRSDFFPGTNRVKVFNPSLWSDAGGKWFNKEADGSFFSQHYLSQISETTTGLVSFSFDQGDNGMRYTITFEAGPGTCNRRTWTQSTSNDQSFLLPNVTLQSEEWAFAGWCETQLDQVVTERPVLYERNTAYTPKENVTLYAVFTYLPQEGYWTSNPADFDSTCHTVTFEACAGSCETEQLTQAAPYFAIELPAVVSPLEDWDFVGWSTEMIADTVAKEPDLLVAGTGFVPAADTTLYAVFMKDNGSRTVWKQIAPASVIEGTYAIISTDGYGFCGTIADGAGMTTATAYEFSDNLTETAPEDVCEITVTALEEGGYTLYNANHGYLVALSNAIGNLSWSNDDSSGWKYTSSNWVYQKNKARLRFHNGAFQTLSSISGKAIRFAQKNVEDHRFFSSTPSAESSGIESIEQEEGNQEQIFSLDGRIVTGNKGQLPSGIYIINGQKIQVK